MIAELPGVAGQSDPIAIQDFQNVSVHTLDLKDVPAFPPELRQLDRHARPREYSKPTLRRRHGVGPSGRAAAP